MKPHTPAEFIGKTGVIARAMFAQVPKLKDAVDPMQRRYLFTGDAGLGKTALAEALAAAITGDPIERVWAGKSFNVEQVNGQSCSVDLVRRWQAEAHYVPMNSKVIIVDEIDATSLAACNELRTYLDKLPPKWVFLATTNLAVRKLQPQLQSRFKVHFFENVPHETIAHWLCARFKLGLDLARQTARNSGGNVRAAETDALNLIETLQALA